jgi:UPF0755 protein
MDNTPLSEIPKTKNFYSPRVFYAFFALCFLVIALYYVLSAPTPSQSMLNRQGTLVHIAPKQSLDSIASDLEAKSIVRQALAVKVFVTVFGGGREIQRGDYLFREGLSVWRVAWMLAQGKHNVEPIRLTFKEGFTNEDMAALLAEKLPAFRKDLFLSDPRSKQGYLFPDTYFLFPLTTSEEILAELSSNFNRRIAPLRQAIADSNRSLSEIIIMASLIEKEAQGKADASLISGILWKRITKGMPLQVDADRYTYTAKGLPKNPISNPGLASITAAVYPVDSPYLYYLHDKNGVVHFAVTYSEHLENIKRYLK